MFDLPFERSVDCSIHAAAIDRLAIAICFFIACALQTIATRAIAQEVYHRPLGARAFALGGGGISDASDGSNASLNPAIVSFSRRLDITFLVSSYTAGEIDIVASGGFVGWGTQIKVKDSWTLGGGLGVGHARDDYHSNLTQNRLHFRSEYAFIGGAVGFRSKVQVGFGATVKAYPVQFLHGGSETATLHDIGLLARMTCLQSDRDTLVLSAGYAHANVGDAVFDPSLGSINIPESNGLGFSVNFFSDRWRPLSFGEDGGGILVASNIDIQSQSGSITGDRNWQVASFEIGMSNHLFMRSGYVFGADAPAPSGISFGGGVRIPMHAFCVEIDFSRWQAREDSYANMFGLGIAAGI